MTDRAKYWARMVTAWEASGLTQAEFCRRRGLKAVTFAWWKRQLLDGRDCVGYSYHQELEEDGETVTVAGTAWLDAETGAPRAMTYSPEPLPKFVKSMDIRLLFSTDEAGGWFLTGMQTEVDAGLLFIRKHMRLGVEFQDHWRMPPKTDP